MRPQVHHNDITVDDADGLTMAIYLTPEGASMQICPARRRWCPHAVRQHRRHDPIEEYVHQILCVTILRWDGSVRHWQWPLADGG